MSTFEKALGKTGAFAAEANADVTIGTFFWQPGYRKRFVLRAITIVLAVWFVVFSVVLFSATTLSAATHLTQTYKIGYIGDSITVGVGSHGSANAVEAELSLLGDTYEAVNKGVNGMSTNQWLPGERNFDEAVAEFEQKDITVVSIMLGTNDARKDQMTTSAAYVSNLRMIIRGLLSTGTIKKVILNYPPYIFLGSHNQWNKESQQLLASYLVGIDALVNGTTVLQGDTKSYGYFAAHPDQLIDGVHPSADGYVSLGALWAAGFEKILADSENNTIVSKQITGLLLQK